MNKHAFITKFTIGKMNTRHPDIQGFCRQRRALRVVRLVAVRELELLAILFHALTLEVPFRSREKNGIVVFLSGCPSPCLS